MGFPARARLILALALVCFLCVPLLAADEKAKARDWKTNPAIVELSTTHDIQVLGDIHGDYDRLVTLLVAAKIIEKDPPSPDKVRWTAGKSVLVCMGDMIDKWKQSLQVLALLRGLQTDAARAGGRVVILMGNHEAEFLADSRNKKAKEFVKELKAKKIKPEDVAAGTDDLGIGTFLRNLPMAARIDDWFFAHAGNTHGRSLARLARDLQAGVERNGFGASVLSDKDSLLQARMHPAPWWERAGDSPVKSRERLVTYLKALGAKHLVIGHQPGKVSFADGSTRKAGELNQYLEGLIFLTDVGMSRGVGNSSGALLRIHDGKATVVFANGSTKKIW